MEQKISKKKYTYILVVCLIMLVVFISFSYAFFKGGLIMENPSETKITSGVLDLDIKGNQNINITNAKILNEDELATKKSEFKFQIFHTTTSTVDKAVYFLHLENINISDNLKSKYFNWSLEKSGNLINSGTFEDFNGSNIKLNNEGLVLANGSVDELTLKLWLVNNLEENQNDLLEGNFSATIKLESYIKAE